MPATRNETGADWPDLAGRIVGQEHVLPVRVYYEDTDFSGVVYHANYLKFCERGRSDWLRLLGLHHSTLFTAGDDGDRLAFAVRRMEADFLGPAHIDDVLEVRTRLVGLSGARLDLAQQVWRGEMELFRARTTIVMIDGAGRPKRLPSGLKSLVSPMLDRSGGAIR